MTETANNNRQLTPEEALAVIDESQELVVRAGQEVAFWNLIKSYGGDLFFDGDGLRGLNNIGHDVNSHLYNSDSSGILLQLERGGTSGLEIAAFLGEKGEQLVELLNSVGSQPVERWRLLRRFYLRRVAGLANRVQASRLQVYKNLVRQAARENKDFIHVLKFIRDLKTALSLCEDSRKSLSRCRENADSRENGATRLLKDHLFDLHDSFIGCRDESIVRAVRSIALSSAYKYNLTAEGMLEALPQLQEILRKALEEQEGIVEAYSRKRVESVLNPQVLAYRSRGALE